jgi:hypothetical protein
MSTLAGLLFSQPPPSFYEWERTIVHLNLSRTASKFLWNGLSEDTRSVYDSARRSYEYYCSYHNIKPWPAQEHTLAEWASARAEGNSQIRYQGKVKAKTIFAMMSALRSVHVDRRLSLKPFESEWLKRILAGISRCQPDDNTKKAEPMSLSTLEKVIDTGDKTVDELNFNAACKIAFAGFLRSGEFTYSATDFKDTNTFTNTKLTRSDIRFSDDNKYAILRLKRSKTDTMHQGVEIILAASNNICCPVTALKTLLTRDPQPLSAPLFRLSGAPFDYNGFVKILRKRLREIGEPKAGLFSGHSFRRGASQHASDNGMLDYDIQRLGRWSSDAFKLYFNESYANRYNLNKRFLTGSAPAISSL